MEIELDHIEVLTLQHQLVPQFYQLRMEQLLRSAIQEQMEGMLK